MAKKYFYTLIFCIFSLALSAQENRISADQTIEGLSFYPNPVSSGKIFITSKSSMSKGVTIFDVLGKTVLNTELNGKELNVSTLSPGVYIIKIREGEATATRKLIVK